MVHFHANNCIVCLCSLHCSCVLNIMHEFEVGRFLDKDRQKRNVMIWFRQAFSLRLSLEKTVSLCLVCCILAAGCCVVAGFCTSLTPLNATTLRCTHCVGLPTEPSNEPLRRFKFHNHGEAPY